MSRYQTYPEYKESNIGWMGAVPKSWDIIPCRAVVRDIADKNIGAADQNYLSVMANIGVIRYEDKGDVGNKKPDDLSKCKIVRAGNLVINSMNYAIGSYGMSPYDGVCSPVYIVLGINEAAMESRFALRTFENTPFQKYLATFGNGILEHRAAIGWDDIKGAQIALPSKVEQLAILNFLDHETAKIDALIEKQQRLIELLKEKRQAVISHAVTKGLNPNAPLKDSGVEWLGEVPTHWVVAKFKHLVVDSAAGPYGASLTKSMYTTSGIRVYGQQQVIPGDFSIGDYYISEEKFEAMRRYEVFPGDILISVMGTVGKVAVVPENIERGIINPRLVKYKISLKKLMPEFVKQFILSDASQSFLLFSAQGSTMDGLNMQIIGDLTISYPSIEEQLEILEFISSQSKKFVLMIERAESAVDLLTERRTALISAAVTGKIDVRDWQVAA